jgi:predicted nucleic acid-binding protein
MSARAFVDTNILVYAHDSAAGSKHLLAKSLVAELWESRSAVISTQVLQEFYVTVRKKVLKAEDAKQAKRWVSHYLNWNVVANDGASVLRAIEIEQRYQLSFWDAMIVQAAKESGATLLYSEDLNHSQVLAGVRVHNPLIDAP